MSDQAKKTETLDPSVEVLFPEQQIKLGDELITMPEITFVQGLRFGLLLKPLIYELAELFNANQGQDLSLSDIQTAFEKNGIAVIEVLAQLINKEPKFIENLSDTEGQSLMLVFWQVNQAFFLNRLMSKKLTAAAKPPPP